MGTIFSKIAAGEIPSYKIGESDKFFAFLDINPLAEGHTLVIPRREVDYLFDMADGELAEMMIFAKSIAKKLERAVKCKRVAVMVLGLEVPHAHIHLIPINTEADVNLSNKLKFTPEQFQEIQSRIIQ